MKNNIYRIKVRKGDLEIEVQGDKDFVVAKFEELSSKERQPQLIEEVSSDFLTKIADKKLSHPDIVLAFAYYLHNFEKMESYNVNDFQKCYGKARIQPPKNVNDTINGVKVEYLIEAKEKKDGLKSWVITRAGEKYIDNILKKSD